MSTKVKLEREFEYSYVTWSKTKVANIQRSGITKLEKEGLGWNLYWGWHPPLGSRQRCVVVALVWVLGLRVEGWGIRVKVARCRV